MSKTSPCTTVCRICLATDARTLPISETPLQTVFELMTSTALHTPEQKPVTACYICYYQLKKSYKLIQMSVKAENVLTDIFKRCNKITKQSISLVNRNAKSLSKYLSISQMDYCDITLPKNCEESSDDDKIEVKLEKVDDEQVNMETEIFEEDNTEVDDSEYAYAVPIRSFDVMHNHISPVDDDLSKPVMEEKPDVTEMDNDSEYILPIRSVTVIENHTPQYDDNSTHIKGENPDGETAYVTEKSDTQKKSIRHVTPKISTSTRPRPHECKICHQRYYKRAHLQRHVMMHADVRPFTCHLCDSKFRTANNVKNHLWAVHNKVVGYTYKCDKCGSEFKERTLLRKHARTHYYECDYCQRRYSKRPDFIAHLKTHEEINECHICKQLYKKKSTLNKHMKKHQKGELLIQCEHCDAKLPKGLMYVHTRQHNTKLECSVCQESFQSRVYLVQHMRRHTGERPFECNECHKVFISKPNLKAHLKCHFGRKEFQCKCCSYSSMTKSQMTTHMKIHTGERAYQCEFCPKKFRFRQRLTLHVRLHTGEKPFECNVCKKRYADRNSMVRHSKVHGNEKEMS